MKRGEFITLARSAGLAWPLATRAQEAMPVIGFLNPASPDGMGDRLRGFHRGLKESGYIEGERLGRISLGRQSTRAPARAGNRSGAPTGAVIATMGTLPVSAAKAATTTTPIIFLATEDPVGLGLVASLARPGGNLTGINLLSGELASKRLELLREMLPAATRVAVLVNPINPTNSESMLRELELVARAVGLQLRALSAARSR
jgi:putative ABC transport system substrate-binding protein